MVSFFGAFFGILVQPHKVFQRIMDRGANYFVWPIVVAFTLFQVVDPKVYIYALKRLPFWEAILAGTAANWAGGTIFFFLFSWFYYQVGILLGGKGTYREVRAAYAWSLPPWFLGQLLMAVSAIPIWAKIFTGFADDSSVLSESHNLLVTLASYSSHVLKIGSFFLSLFTISQAHQFSLWKSFLTFVLICLSIILAALLTGVLIGIVFK